MICGRLYAVTLAMLCFVTAVLPAANTATVQIIYSIDPIDAIAVSGYPGPIVIRSAKPGSNPSGGVDGTTTFAVTTNCAPRKVTGQLSTAMPPGTTLFCTMTAPTGATSVGPVPLTTSPQDLVTGIGCVAQASLGVTYNLVVDVNASPVPVGTNLVTFMITP